MKTNSSCLGPWTLGRLVNLPRPATKLQRLYFTPEMRYVQYGGKLQQLGTHLAKTELQRTNESLLKALSCMLEVFLPTGLSNFLKRQRSIETIMQLRGPPSETEGSTVANLRGLRVLSIVGALADSRPLIYAKKA